jgi:hypothetical protein
MLVSEIVASKAISVSELTLGRSTTIGGADAVLIGVVLA